MANESGASLIGVDLSPVAVELGTSRAVQLGRSRTRFVHGTFAETGLDSQSVHAAMSEDALQYAPDKRAAMVEVARILKAGGRFAFTAFELDPDRTAGLPILGEDPVSDYREPLGHAGFSVDLYEEVPGWPEPMTTVYQSLLNAREALIAEMGDRAVNALFAELTITLVRRPYHRRIFVSATKA
jgi:SAM-dependent methyltransferase